MDFYNKATTVFQKKEIYESAPIFRFEKVDFPKPVPNETHPPFENFHIEVGNTTFFLTENNHYNETTDNQYLYRVIQNEKGNTDTSKIKQFDISKCAGEVIVREYLHDTTATKHSESCRCRESFFSTIASDDESEFLTSIPTTLDFDNAIKQFLLARKALEFKTEYDVDEQRMETVCPRVQQNVMLAIKLLSMIEQINCGEYNASAEMSRQVRRNAQRKGVAHPVPYIMLPARYQNKGDGTRHHSQHRYRYRVRGHWRTYCNEKKWVKTHERGLANLICIQKEYIVK